VVCSVVLPALLFILDRHIFRLSTAWLCDVIFGYCCKSSRNAEGEALAVARHATNILEACRPEDSHTQPDLSMAETTLSKEHGYW
jgi:hypothetical protein